MENHISLIYDLILIIKCSYTMIVVKLYLDRYRQKRERTFQVRGAGALGPSWGSFGRVQGRCLGDFLSFFGCTFVDDALMDVWNFYAVYFTIFL